MADASHLERMGRELKCPICLSLFSSAVSLTCNHVFCNSCIQKSMKSDSSCPVCKVPCMRREVRPAPHMENLVHIYKSMEIASGFNIFVTQNDTLTKNTDEEKQVAGGSITSNKKCVTKRAMNNVKLSKKASKSKSPGTKPAKRSFRTNKRVQVPRSPLPETPTRLVTSKPEGETMNCAPNSELHGDYTPLNGKGNHSLRPLFWLREEDADKLTQSTDIAHLTLTPVNVPNFSDIKDSDDDVPGEMIRIEEASSKHNVANLFDSEMFEWTQGACSPELCSTPVKFQVPLGDDEGQPEQISGTSSEGGTGGRVLTDCNKLNSPVNMHSMNGSALHNPEKEIIGKLNGCGKSRKRTRNISTRSQSKRTKGSQRNVAAADSAHEFVSDQGCVPNNHLKNFAEEKLLNHVDKNVASKGMILKNRNSKSNERQSKMQAESRLQSDSLKLDPSKQAQRQNYEATVSEQPKLSTKSLRKKELSARVDNCCASSTATKYGQEVKCKRRVDVSMDIGLIDKQDDANVGIHAESADTTGPQPSLNAGNVLRKCQSNSNRIVCGFCHSAEETEHSGEMINYFQGRPVLSDFVGRSGVIHSHKSCTEWAPNVYFQDEIAINLEAELTRSRRIKCSLCGDKGAALGCYDTSCRRSFHVPCAKRLKQSRWDTDNFVMLCPLHSSSKLANEQNVSQVKRKNNSKSTQSQSATNHGTTTSFWDSRGCSDKLHLCCSALTTGEKEIVTEFKSLSGASVSKIWNASVTHVIASTDENGACKRTLKVLMGILEGKWILSIEWIKACLSANKVVDESTYEINIDTHGIKGGPQLGRLRLENKQPKVFAGMKFYLSGDFEPSYKGYLHDLIISAGGNILHRKPIVEDEGNLPRDNSMPSTVIVYSLELSNKNDINKDMILNGRQEEAQALAKASGSKAASNLWVLSCISGYKLQPLLGSTI